MFTGILTEWSDSSNFVWCIGKKFPSQCLKILIDRSGFNFSNLKISDKPTGKSIFEKSTSPRNWLYEEPATQELSSGNIYYIHNQVG